MLKPDKRCKVCQTLKTDKKLMERIYNSKAFIPGGESLRALSRDYVAQFEYQSLYNHAKTHQGLSEEDLDNKLMMREAREIEVAQLRKIVRHQEMRDELLGLGMDGIRDDKIKLNSNNVIQLLKQKADIESKSKDRELDVAKMIQAFASGANREVIEVASDGVTIVTD